MQLCKAENEVGATTRTFSVSVVARPRLDDDEANTTRIQVLPETSVTLDCSRANATEANAPLVTYEWSRDGLAISVERFGSKYKLLDRGRRLQIVRIVADDTNANLTCRIFNRAGDAQKSFLLSLIREWAPIFVAIVACRAICRVAEHRLVQHSPRTIVRDRPHDLARVPRQVRCGFCD